MPNSGPDGAVPDVGARAPQTHLGAAIVLAVLGLLAPAAAEGQAGPLDGWSWGISGTGIAWTDPDWDHDRIGSVGLRGTLHRDGVGVHFELNGFPPTGRYGLTGASAIAGVTVPFGAEAPGWTVRAGATGIAGGDSDGSVLIGGGPYAGLGLALPVLSVQARALCPVPGLFTDFCRLTPESELTLGKIIC